jgi:ABC-type transport system, involved in lipoprotein release, permease component
MLISSIKLTFRSWLRNQMFAIISLLSLAVGFTCTNFAVTFIIHEFNIEAANPNRKNILFMSQDSPMRSGEKVSYVSAPIAPAIKDMFPEVEDYLRVNSALITDVIVNKTRFEPINILQADESLTKFFPYQALYGNLMEALTEPNKIALTISTAQRLFGEENPIGKHLSVNTGGFMENVPPQITYQVCAILKEYDQSFLHFDGITKLPSYYNGGICMLLMNKPVDREAFANQLKQNKIQTFQGDIGRYYFSTLQENYFQEYNAERIPHINRQNKLLLYTSALSAILIFLIAGFNYINLNFSRLLQQVKMIHTQKIMGASKRDINSQLLTDTFLMVFISFCLSFLFMYLLLPYFNEVMSGKLTIGFFFNKQAFPVLCGFVFLLSAIPAWFVSRKINKLSLQGYHEFFTGKKRRIIISTLSIAQFAISIALIMAMLGINSQVNLIRQGGEGYRDLIQIGEWQNDDGNALKPFVAELRSRPDIEEITVAPSSLLYGSIRQMIVRSETGEENYYPLQQLIGNNRFLSTFHIELLQGFSPEEAASHYAHPAYINERFASVFVKDGENPIGKPLDSYDENSRRPKSESTEQTHYTIAGIVRDFYTNSLEEEVLLTTILIDNSDDSYFYVYIRLNPEKPEQLTTIKEIYEKHNPDKYFTYDNVYQAFIDRNSKTFEFSRLILMYALISIFLTCFGLFGMTMYATEQRTKEIGIRKVNGATSLQIIYMLNRQFIIWIAIAFIIAAPITWYLLNRWLESYVYRTSLNVGICLIAVLIVMAISLLTVTWFSLKTASQNPVTALRDE